MGVAGETERGGWGREKGGEREREREREREKQRQRESIIDLQVCIFTCILTPPIKYTSIGSIKLVF